MKTKTKKKTAAAKVGRSQRATPTQLARLLAARLRHRPERLAVLARALAKAARVRLQLRFTLRELRQLRQQVRTQQQRTQQALAPTTTATAATDLLPPADSRSYAHIVASLHLAGFPVAWADSLTPATSPQQVAAGLLAATRRTQ
jgi:hypothetical protein